MSLEKKLGVLKDAIDDVMAELKEDGGGSRRRSREDDDEEAPARRRSRDEEDEEAPARRRSRGGDDDEAPSKRRAGRPSEKDKKKKGEDKPDKLTLETVRQAYGEFLGKDTDGDYDARFEFIEAVLQELGIDMIKDMDKADFPKAMYWLDRKAAGKKVNFDDDGSDQEEDRGSSRRRSVV